MQWDWSGTRRDAGGAVQVLDGAGHTLVLRELSLVTHSLAVESCAADGVGTVVAPAGVRLGFDAGDARFSTLSVQELPDQALPDAEYCRLVLALAPVRTRPLWAAAGPVPHTLRVRYDTMPRDQAAGSRELRATAARRTVYELRSVLGPARDLTRSGRRLEIVVRHRPALWFAGYDFTRLSAYDAGLAVLAAAAESAQVVAFFDDRPARVAGAADIESGVRDLLGTVRAAPTAEDTRRALERDVTWQALARLGRGMFFDTRLSVDGTISCASCHHAARSFTDGRPLARGVAELSRNTLPLINPGRRTYLFWDGRADSLASQALFPWLDHREHGLARHKLIDIVTKYYGPALAEIFASPATGADDILARAGLAVEAYERTLVADQAPIDVYARQSAARQLAAPLVPGFGAREAAGLRVFVRSGCSLCHHGPDFTDGEFHNTGLAARGDVADRGRAAGLEFLRASGGNMLDCASGPLIQARRALAGPGPRFPDARACGERPYLGEGGPESVGAFRTPTLRNLQDTAPYQHDGRFAALDEVLDHYNLLTARTAVGHREESLRPLFLTETEREQLRAFLLALSGPVRDLSGELSPANGARGELAAIADFVPDSGSGTAPLVEPLRMVSRDGRAELVVVRARPNAGGRLVLNELTELELLVRVDGQPAQGPVTFDARMPAHGHGMFLEAQVIRLAPGRFGVRGVKLHMPGPWELRFVVTAGARRWSLVLPYEVR